MGAQKLPAAPVADLCDANASLILTGELRILEPVFQEYGQCISFSGQVVTMRVLEHNVGESELLETPGINSFPIGVRALASHPRHPGADGVPELHVDVEFAGAVIRDGEWLYADTDGIIVCSKEIYGLLLTCYTSVPT
jgi:regulator of RNase E activity RraA